MAQVIFEVSTDFLTRMRAAIVAEQPDLSGETNAVKNEAARVKVRQMVRDWVLHYEKQAAKASAESGLLIPGDADIT